MGGRGANSNKKQYIRFGDVPKSGKSINWLTMTNDDADVIQWDLENGGELRLRKMPGKNWTIFAKKDTGIIFPLSTRHSCWTNRKNKMKSFSRT